MKCFTLLSLALVGLCGCADTATNNPYEVNKPVVEDQIIDETTNPGVMSDPQETPVNPPAPTEGPALPADQPTATLEDPSDLASDTANDNGVVVDTNDDITSNIRKEIDDADLSDMADKVQVSAVDGRVNLSGEVQSQEEKDRIEAIAVKTAGEGNVDSTITVEDAQ